MSLSVALALAALVSGTGETQNAVANGDTRTLTIYHTHTKESATITFRRDGSYDRAALDKLNWILRDWRRDEPTSMDPRLFDIVWEVHREVGSREAVNVVSAYRSPETNAMLRHRSGAVAKHSQHMLGKAMDFSLPDVTMDKVRAVGMRLQRGGVGYYPSGNPFVHLDVGSVRSWPRMTHDQLARLFPDGKTVHLPSDGRPLPGYEVAKAEILGRGGSVAGYAAYAEAGEGTASGPRKSLWAYLFGGSDEAEDTALAQPTRTARGTRAARLAARASPPPPAATVVVANAGADDAGAKTFFASDNRGGTAAPPAATPRATVALASPRRPAAAPALAAPSVAPTEVALAPAAPAPSETRRSQLALAPLPPRRPDELASTVVLAEAPLPPARPVELAALVPLRTETRPESLEDTDATALANLAASAGRGRNERPLAALAYAPIEASVSPVRPAAPPRVPAAPAGAASGILERIAAVHAGNPTYSSEHSLRALYAGTATGSLAPGKAPRPGEASTPPVQAAAARPVPRTPEPTALTSVLTRTATRFDSTRFGAPPSAAAMPGFGFR